MTHTTEIFHPLRPWIVERVRASVEAALPAWVRLAEMARVARLSPTHFVRTYGAATGEPPHAWVLRRRLQGAAWLLVYTRLPIIQIALECGYATPGGLSGAFRRQFNLTPSQYRRWGNPEED